MKPIIELIEKYLGPKASGFAVAGFLYFTGSSSVEEAFSKIAQWIETVPPDNTVLAGLVGFAVYLIRRASPEKKEEKIYIPGPTQVEYVNTEPWVDPDTRTDPPDPPVIKRTKKQPRGIRNNNPLNIEATVGKATPWKGESAQSDGRYAIFDEPHYGIRAALYLLRISYFRRHQIHSVLSIVNRWAPEEDANPTKIYAETVAKRIGVGIVEQIDLDDDDLLIALFKAMAKFELGQEVDYTQEQYQRALDELPKKGQ